MSVEVGHIRYHLTAIKYFYIYTSSFDRKNTLLSGNLSYIVDKHSVFHISVLQVENKALESGTKQCSFHVPRVGDHRLPI